MRPILDPHIDPKARRQRLLEPDAYAQPDHGCEAAVRDRGCDVDGADGEAGASRKRGEVDVGEVDNGEGAEGEGVFRVGYGGDEVCEVGGVSKMNGKRYARECEDAGARAHGQSNIKFVGRVFWGPSWGPLGSE